jgi:hypothetical protein
LTSFLINQTESLNFHTPSPQSFKLFIKKKQTATTNQVICRTKIRPTPKTASMTQKKGNKQRARERKEEERACFGEGYE